MKYKVEQIRTPAEAYNAKSVEFRDILESALNKYENMGYIPFKEIVLQRSNDYDVYLIFVAV
jgi:hypothetical protein